jgi:hypothetical protein
MEQVFGMKETTADVFSTETARDRALEHSARMSNLAPHERSAARREGALLLGFNGLLAIITDLNRRSRTTHNLPATLRWSGNAHGWIFR